MRIKDFIEREFNLMQQRQDEDIRELAIRCAEQCEVDGYAEGFRDGIGLDVLVLKIVSLASQFVDGRIEIDELSRVVTEWNETLDNTRRNID